jgi:hypothetical protein
MFRADVERKIKHILFTISIFLSIQVFLIIKQNRFYVAPSHKFKTVRLMLTWAFWRSLSNRGGWPMLFIRQHRTSAVMK